jgi:prenylcysteine oxidase / farnesylcysteine lyase
LIPGAGPAGVSAAQTLSASFKSKDINIEIVIFEQKHQIGGRIVPNPSFPKEHLGRIIHAEDVATGDLGGNILKERARNVLGFQYRQKPDSWGKEVGFFDGRSLVARLTRPLSELSWGAWLSLVWKYKFSFLNAKELPKGTMKSFEGLLMNRDTFESVSDMVKAADIEGAMGLSAVARLSANHIGGQYVHEVLCPQVLRQTGQTATELSDLAISMALEREYQVSGADAGTFEAVLGKFVGRSGAELRLSTTVTGLKRELVDERKDAWVLEFKKSGQHALEYEAFDHVILTGPSSLLPKHTRLDDEVYYRSLWVTFVVSTKELNKEYFGSSDEMPAQILPILSENLPSELEGMHEISYIGDVFGPDVNTEAVRKLYRIFSDRSLSKGDILAFGEGGVIEMWEESIEHAYPLMWPRNGKFGYFKVEKGLWRTGVIEAIGNSVDLSWVAGENAGRLVAKEVGRRRT